MVVAEVEGFTEVVGIEGVVAVVDTVADVVGSEEVDALVSAVVGVGRLDVPVGGAVEVPAFRQADESSVGGRVAPPSNNPASLRNSRRENLMALKMRLAIAASVLLADYSHYSSNMQALPIF